MSADSSCVCCWQTCCLMPMTVFPLIFSLFFQLKSERLFDNSFLLTLLNWLNKKSTAAADRKKVSIYLLLFFSFYNFYTFIARKRSKNKRESSDVEASSNIQDKNWKLFFSSSHSLVLPSYFSSNFSATQLVFSVFPVQNFGFLAAFSFFLISHHSLLLSLSLSTTFSSVLCHRLFFLSS